MLSNVPHDAISSLMFFYVFLLSFIYILHDIFKSFFFFEVFVVDFSLKNIDF